MTKRSVSGFAISRCKGIGEFFSTNAIDRCHKITIDSVTITKGTSTYLFVIAAFLASIDHMGSLNSPTVALGLNTISAPFNPNAFQVNS